ncbi:MAG: HAD-IIIA family hydrolase [Bacteroidales bacterium]|nr:HAD-IIIA family hydrolase [Bacteroidales bacterium]
MECVVLAGGMGTRLRSVVADLPKCMAPVAGKPFLHYIVESLETAGFDHIIFSLGYKHEAIEEWIAGRKGSARITYVVETEPMGTGGGVRYALSQATEKDVFVLNGDTYFDVSYRKMLARHKASGAVATLALKPMEYFDRYGEVAVDTTGHITAFREKRPCEEGLINGGVYVIRRDALDVLPEKFSIEKEFFEKEVSRGTLAGFVSDGYFIDIGIPEDYERAQEEFAKGVYKRFDTLFLDRDGVINVQIVGDYVRRPEQMQFISGSLEALARLRPVFRRMIVVTNQRGVGKGLMTEEDLKAVHDYMCNEVERAGGHLDAIYYCTIPDDSCPRRKPNPGMMEDAKADFPDIDLSRSIMVGDKESDMLFAERAGVWGIMVDGEFTLRRLADKLID